MSEYQPQEEHPHDDLPGSRSFSVWLRRLWPLYCLLAALATFGYALYDSYQIDGDAVAYMDIADLIHAHHWAAAVNGYWNPLYPAMLALGQILFHATRFTELHAYYMVNFAIFLLEMVAVTAFTDSIIRLRSQRETATAHRSRFFLERYALRYIGIALLLIATQRELSMGKVRPDALLQAFLLLALAALLNYLTTGLLRFAGLMGLVLGLAYLTKSFAFVFTFLCILALIAFRTLWQKEKPMRALLAGLLAFVGFALVAGPFIAALSRQKGHFDFGDSGALNYAWFVGGTEKMHLQPYQTDLFGSAEVHLKHPNKELLREPGVFSYKQLPHGTYPDWFDPTFWNDQVKPHNTIRRDIPRALRNLVLVARYLLNHPEGWIFFALLLALGGTLRTGIRPKSNAFWLAPILLGASVWGIYGIVNVEERYVTIGYLAILLPLFAALCERTQDRPSSANPALGATAAPALVLLFAMLAVSSSARTILEMRRDLSVKNYPGGWYNPDIFQAAQALNASGVGPGDTIACIGTSACLYDHYWARLAGVRILTEVYDPEGDVYSFLAHLSNRDQVIDTVRQQGGKILVGYFENPGEMTGASSASQGWSELGETHYYQYPLNLPSPQIAPTQGTH